MLLKAPAGVTAVTVGGLAVAVVDGLIDVPEAAATTLYAHGFKPWSKAEDAAAAPPEPSRMTRQEMLAFLEAKGVAVKRPIGNKALRALLRELAAKEA